MITHHSPLTTHYSRWLHRWAVLTACATFVLLLLGAVVTTFRVGMVDPIWPTYPWHLLLVTCFLVYLQIVFGALFRHTYSTGGQRGHLLTAFAVVAATAWIVKETIDLQISDKRLKLAVWCLAALVAVQLLLGVEAWMV